MKRLKIPPPGYGRTADASFEYRERTGVLIASSRSAADTGNLAAATRDSTFKLQATRQRTEAR